MRTSEPGSFLFSYGVVFRKTGILWASLTAESVARIIEGSGPLQERHWLEIVMHAQTISIARARRFNPASGDFGNVSLCFLSVNAAHQFVASWVFPHVDSAFVLLETEAANFPFAHFFRHLPCPNFPAWPAFAKTLDAHAMSPSSVAH